ncbi:hypothetical protein HKT49_32620, partial [Pseudomonas aeruginosa]|nr:hypothetical protein [Pseudomonas aeruginosa]
LPATAIDEQFLLEVTGLAVAADEIALVRQGVLLWLLVLAGLWAMGWLHA